MKDLFVYTADSDMQAVMTAVLNRSTDLAIRPISYRVERFTGRDSGMVKDGPEIARAKVSKKEYARLILMWDHHGSGWHKLPAQEVTAKVQARLDGVTWTDRSAALVIVPELEEWIWHCRTSVASCIGVPAANFDVELNRAANRLKRPVDHCRGSMPKELFESVLYLQKRRKPLPEDYTHIGRMANLGHWTTSESFGRLTALLKVWFPIL